MADEDLLYRIGADVGGFEAGMGKVLALAGKFAGFVGLAIGLKQLATEALNNEVAWGKLQTAMGHTADGSTKLFGQMKDLAKQMGVTAGFTETQMAGALTKLTQVTGSSELAMKAIGPAMEFARAKGFDLEHSATMVGRAYEMGTKSIARQTQMYGDNVKGMAAIDLIQKRFAGNIEKYANTAKGELESAGAVFMRLGSGAVKPLVDITADLGKGLAEAASKGVDAWKPFKGIFQDIVNLLREIAGVWIPTVLFASEKMVASVVGNLKDLIFGRDINKSRDENKKIWDDITKFAIQRQKEETAAIKAGKNQEVQADKDAATIEQDLGKARWEGANELFKGLSSLQKTKNKELFEIGKAASMASIVVSTAEAIMNAWAKIPPPFNMAFAAGAATAGAVELAAASGAAFNPGGAATGLYADESMISTFQPREMVIPQRFSDLIASGKFSLHGGTTTNTSGDTHINIYGADNKSARQIALEIAHYFKAERGGRLVRSDGSMNL